MEFTKLISTQEIRKHHTPEDCWIVLDDQVWDVTTFAPQHPGGANCTPQHAILLHQCLN
jgi:L-lactate dehydrogenase (cytochrome)